MKDLYSRDFKGVWIPKELWLSKDLTLVEKVVLVEIDSLDNENHCTASNSYLADFCNCSETAISNAISALIKLGYIEKVSFDGRVRKLRVKTLPYKKCNSNLQELQISIPNNNNIDNNINIEQIPKRTSKQEKNLEKISLKLSEYNFSENIEELILRFYSDKIDCGQYIPDNQLEAQLTRLAQEKEDQQLIAINRAIEGGWKNITAYFNNDFNKPEVPGYHIHKDGDQNHWQHPQHNGAREKAKTGISF